MTTPEPILRTRALSKTYTRGAAFSRRVTVRALADVTLEVATGSVLAVVGESGGGKSTLARCLALLEEPTTGEVFVDGRPVSALAERDRRRLRPRLQLLFQDPASSLNPAFTVAEAVAEPLVVRGWGDSARRRARALELMGEVGLGAELADRGPLEISGGQKQRLVLARALAAEPRALLLDEALSGLDPRRQRQVVRLLRRLRERHGLTYVVVTHDLRLAARVADRVAVLERGRLVETGAADEILERPRHPATRRLVASMLGRAAC